MVFQISKAQMQDGVYKDDQSYAEWYVHSFMTEHFPEAIEITGEYDLIRMSLTGIKYARHFRFCTRNQQGMFLTIMNSFGPDFWRFPGFDEIIYDDARSPEKKFEDIFETLTQEQKNAAAFNADSDFWFDHLVPDNPFTVSHCGAVSS